MQNKLPATLSIRQIAGKEIKLFFASPIAYLFLAAFAAITLFIFFWGDAFFARNIADVQPLFQWMPVLLIFLCSTLSMRMWSEERRSGTLEYLLTRPVPLRYFVIGKFIGCLSLLIIALVITLPLPCTVSLLGQLDWGPVWSAYLATILLGGCYLAIGLFVSSRCDNQIVSLICSCALCGFFFLLGSPIITDLLSTQQATFMRLLGTSSRFSSITRGVLDLRDLYYYLSLIIVFLCLNGYMLERERWAKNVNSTRHRWIHWAMLLVIGNALLANVWLSQLTNLRIDTTKGKIYTLSQPTRQILAHLQEPLLIQGYFSHKTHPLLAPLVPQLKNLIREYGVHGHGKVRVQFADPTTNSAAQKQAISQYGIRPVPFQVDNRYQSSVVSSYFDVVISYGGQYKVLNFRNLISAKRDQNNQLDVQLRNPEYDITAAIAHVIKEYQSSGNLFNTITEPLTFTGYLSAKSELPKPLQHYQQVIHRVLHTMQKQAHGRLSVQFNDPSAQPKLAHQIAQKFGFKPMTTNLLSQQRFYFYMTLGNAQQQIQIPLGNLQGSDFKRHLKAAIKHFAKGFTKTIALVTPNAPSPYAQGPHYRQLIHYLSRNFDVRTETLNDGHVSADADLLVLMAPHQLNRKQLFAVDQYLMQGGTVIAAASPYQLHFTQDGITLQQHRGLFLKWLQHLGLNVQSKLVMDPQNTALPIPITRTIAGMSIRQYEMIDYPYFADIRSRGLNAHTPITDNLGQATVPWASPIVVDKHSGVHITPLLHSSTNSWLSANTDVMPTFHGNQMAPFTPQGKTGRQLVGVMAQGRFSSYFANQTSPLVTQSNATKTHSKSAKTAAAKQTAQINSVLTHSPTSARVILFSSPSMLRDSVLQLSASVQQSQYLNTLKLVDNAAHYALADTALLGIHARSHFNRTLMPMSHQVQLFWEYLNYAAVIVILVVIALIRRFMRRAKNRRYNQLINE
ncbi:Gldg family protein [Celerinatantimonas yamalensis]|uniref:Gldg family protein n=1 Tax=Celerinatantimonas yamalensis TaxID=559956 RepID=A0ABW9G4F1_9GAMM